MTSEAWPRGAALAEATWSGQRRPGFSDFQRRLELLQPLLRQNQDGYLNGWEMEMEAPQRCCESVTKNSQFPQVNFREANGRQALQSQVLEASEANRVKINPMFRSQGTTRSIYPYLIHSTSTPSAQKPRPCSKLLIHLRSFDLP